MINENLLYFLSHFCYLFSLLSFSLSLSSRVTGILLNSALRLVCPSGANNWYQTQWSRTDKLQPTNMAEGIRMKQMEGRLDAIEEGVRQGQDLVEERLETVEVGIKNTHEDISRMRSDVMEMERNLRDDFAHLRVEFTGLS